MNGNDAAARGWAWRSPRGSQESMHVTLAEMPKVGLQNLKRPSPVARQDLQGMHGDTNKPTKLGLKIGLVLKKKNPGTKMEQRLKTWPING